MKEEIAVKLAELIGEALECDIVLSVSPKKKAKVRPEFDGVYDALFKAQKTTPRAGQAWTVFESDKLCEDLHAFCVGFAKITGRTPLAVRYKVATILKNVEGIYV